MKNSLISWGWAAGCAVCLGAADDSTHWSFQPRHRVEPPRLEQGSWPVNPVDRFILAPLEARHLKPAPPASREQLIRRVTFGLTGLPPTPEAVEAFVKDTSPAAYDRLIDRLLASPQYGERWARHWLDLVRYAESDGFEHDALRPHSWRYRDYVVNSFNGDKPYNRFIREQIAGDELWPQDPDAVAATAFHLLGPDMVDSADQVQRRLNTLNDTTDTTASVFLGLTLGCARCHNHKFEPFTQHDYYALQAFYAAASFERELPIPSPPLRAAHDAAMARYRSQAGSTQEQLDAIEDPYRTRLREEKLSALSEDAQLAHRTPKEKRTMEQEGTVQETAPSLKITDAELLTAMAPADQARHKELLAALKAIPKPAPLPMTMALQTRHGPVPKTFVLVRGDYNNPGEEVVPGFPAVLCGSRREEAPIQPESANRKAATDQSLLPSAPQNRRAALADWIANPDNPLTARVMVNRLWQHHFGRGLVATPSDFGTRGARPSHPELLDWLATEFVARGWSVKAMHRLIVSSAAYQQSSLSTDHSPQSQGDPDNRLFSRQTRIRLEGEAIRDGLLAISGRLNLRMGGPSVTPPLPGDSAKTSKNSSANPGSAEHTRRSLYILARRNLRFPFLEVFDAPDNNLTCPERGHSTTAPQSLTLLNSDEVMEAARAAAEGLLKETHPLEEQAKRAFLLILGRPPNTLELTMALEFLKACGSRRQEAETSPSPTGTPPSEIAELCRALFNLNAFVYVD